MVHEGPLNKFALGPVLKSTQVRTRKGQRLGGAVVGAEEGVQFRMEQKDRRLIHADLRAQGPFRPPHPHWPSLFLFSGGAH